MKLLALISGGIDSPVAAYMMSKVGADVILLHLDNGQFGDPKELDKVKKIQNQLEKTTGKKFPLFFANHGASQQRIKEKCEHNYQCVMCKRIMQRVARDFAIKEGCDAIVMGDSLGQVASQTLKNIRAENLGLDFPVVRPLIGMDKLEIIAIAERIGTYDISNIRTKGCSAVPFKPITEAKPDKIKEFDEKMDIDATVNDSVNSIGAYPDNRSL